MTRLVIGLLLAALAPGHRAFAAEPVAKESPAALCSAQVRQFVKETDAILDHRYFDTNDLDDLFVKYLRVKACDVNDVIRISKESKFFTEVYDGETTSYTIFFRSARVVVSFGLVKATGEIDYPAVTPKIPSL